MITEDARIDCERVADIIPPSVSRVLADAYGLEFERASQEERLLIVEAIALSMRLGHGFRKSLAVMIDDSPALPLTIYTPATVGRNEGVRLLAVLQVAIVEHYSAAAFHSTI